MSEIAEYLFYHLVGFGGLLGLLAILVFCFAYYVLYRRRDYQTSIEITCIAWLMILCQVGIAVVNSFRFIGGPPKWWQLELNQFQAFISILFIPTLLTLPVVWSCLQPTSDYSLYKSRLLLMAVLIAFFDVLLYQVIFVPMWGGSFVPVDPGILD